MIKLVFFLAIGYIVVRMIRAWFRVRFVMGAVKGFQVGSDSPFATQVGREKDVTERVRTVD